VPARRLRLRAPDLPDLAGVDRINREGDLYELWTADSDAVVRALVRTGVPFVDLEVSTASLEEAFLALTSPGSQSATPTVAEMAL
jgi:ABC-2 type transport system ATP-binding protein